jgi:hypothetical protein
MAEQPTPPSANEIQRAARAAGLNLSQADAEKLARREQVTLTAEHASKAEAAAAGQCEGIKIINIGNNCGIYLIPFPPRIHFCCTFP